MAKKRKTTILSLVLIACAALIPLFLVDLKWGKTIQEIEKTIGAGSDPESMVVPTIQGHREGCLVCHSNMRGFSDSHSVEALGCSSCHLGNPFTLEKSEAHRQMVLFPGDLETADLTCGSAPCHPDLSKNIKNALMATGRGMVTVNRYVFGEQDTPDGMGHLSRLGHTEADTHLRQLCVRCHLGYKKREYAPANQKSKGGGCTACHLEYSREAVIQLTAYLEKKVLPVIHPLLNIQINNMRCFGCHSRSGRISTNYEGLCETLKKEEEVLNDTRYKILDDKRVFVKTEQDIHHEKGLVCIDCHTSTETMGDGKAYNHQEEQVEISCIDCHFKETPDTIEVSHLDQISKKILELRKNNKSGERFVLTSRKSRPILNLVINSKGEAILTGKLDNKARKSPPLAQACLEIPGHKRLSCQSCHTAWVPTCLGCHTEFNKDKPGWDHLEQAYGTGKWTELKGEFSAKPPALGIRKDHNGMEIIDTFMPGMIMTLGGMKTKEIIGALPQQTRNREYQIFRRLYAPTDAHTTTKKGRTCISCHLDPAALGFGQGELRETAPGGDHWQFFPEYANHPADGLPFDAWTDFLETRTEYTSTRRGARPFSKEEQQKILKVGNCLRCHDEKKENIKKIYINFEESIKKRSKKCMVLP